MLEDLGVVGIIGVLSVGAFIGSQTAIKASRNAETEIRFLRRRFAAMESELAALREQRPVEQHHVEPGPATRPAAETEPVIAEAVTPETVTPDVALPVEPAIEPAAPPHPAPPRPTLPPRPAAPATGLRLEKLLTENWMVWLGGITLALGGAFLVKFSFDQGWIGPEVRVSLGVLLGLGLIFGGHLLSGRSEPTELAGLDPSHVPPALVGAGSAIIFASLYAAFALYDLIGAPVAFVAMAGISGATVLLALRHGPYVAFLGLLGGHAVPLLIQTGHRNAWLLFGYLLLLDAGALALLRWKAWWKLGWVVLALSAAWVLIWLMEPYKTGDEIPIGLFLLALAGGSIALRHGIRGVSWLADPAPAPDLRRLVVAIGVTSAALLYLLVVMAEQSPAALTVMLVYSAGMLAAARHDPDLDRLPWAGAVLGLLTLASWDLPGHIESFDPMRPLVPEHAQSFVTTAALLAGLFGGGGFAALWGAARPGRWAALSSGMMVLVFAVSYWRLSSVGLDWAWAAGALGVAGLLLVAAERVARWRSGIGMEEALAAYAVGVLAALAMAFTIALEDAWLTVALSLMLPGIAWVNGALRVRGLRRVAMLIAVVVLARLALNPYVLDYPIGGGLLFNWLLYGYGLPMLSFAAAAWLFHRDADDRLVQVLEAGAVLFLVLLVSLDIRHAITGSLTSDRYGLIEQAVHSLAWLGIATGLARLPGRRPVPVWASRILIGLATAQILLLQLVVDNPWLNNRSVGEGMIFNTLLLAYGLPAVLYALMFALYRESQRLRRLCGSMGLLLAFVWLTMEVRHGFSSPRMNSTPIRQVELYAYSAVWLAYAAALLAAGLRWRSDALRHAGLGMLVLEVLKVFLIDLAGLTGLWRALSFIGLGAALIGVGYLYRRFVRTQRDSAGQTAEPPAAI